MKSIFFMIMSLSITATIMIGIIMIIKYWSIKRFSKTWHYYVWVLVVARLLIPFSFSIELPVTIMNKQNNVFEAESENNTIQRDNHKEIYREDVGTNNRTYSKENNQSVDYIAKDNISSRFEGIKIVENKVTGIITQGLSVGWIIVSLGMVLYQIHKYLKYKKCIIKRNRKITNPEVLEVIQRVLIELKLKNIPEIYINELVLSPVYVGTIRGMILLPNRNIPKEELYYTLYHELTHFKRKDMVYRWIVKVIVCVHWFNPLIHWMESEINHMCELSCDEAIIKKLSSKEIKQYGDTLIQAAEHIVSPHSLFGGVAFMENKRLLKDRIYSIINYSSRKRVTRLGTTIITGLLILCSIFIGGNHFTIKAESMNKTKMNQELNTENKNIGVDNNLIEEKADDTGKKEETVEYEVNFQQKRTEIEEHLLDDFRSKALLDWDKNKLGITYTSYLEDYVFTVFITNNKKEIDTSLSKNTVELNKTINVDCYFTNQCTSAKSDKRFSEAMKKLVALLDEEVTGPWRNGAVIIVQNYEKVGTDVGKILDYAYEESDCNLFIDMKSFVEDKVLLEYAKKAWKEDKLRIFLHSLNEVEAEKITSLAKEIYEAKDIMYLGDITQFLTQDALKELATSAYQDERVDAFFELSLYMKQKTLKSMRAIVSGSKVYENILEDCKNKKDADDMYEKYQKYFKM